MATRDTHRHRAARSRLVGRSTVCLNPKTHVAAAHEGVLTLEECRCGAVRYVSTRKAAREATEWVVAFVVCTHCHGTGVHVDADAARVTLDRELDGKRRRRTSGGGGLTAEGLRVVQRR